jgi:hypothetical protein
VFESADDGRVADTKLQPLKPLLTDEVERMRQETEELLKESARLMRIMEERLEDNRQRRAVQEALLKQREEFKKP